MQSLLTTLIYPSHSGRAPFGPSVGVRPSGSLTFAGPGRTLRLVTPPTMPSADFHGAMGRPYGRLSPGSDTPWTSRGKPGDFPRASAGSTCRRYVMDRGLRLVLQTRPTLGPPNPISVRRPACLRSAHSGARFLGECRYRHPFAFRHILHLHQVGSGTCARYCRRNTTHAPVSRRAVPGTQPASRPDRASRRFAMGFPAGPRPAVRTRSCWRAKADSYPYPSARQRRPEGRAGRTAARDHIAETAAVA